MTVLVILHPPQATHFQSLHLVCSLDWCLMILMGCYSTLCSACNSPSGTSFHSLPCYLVFFGFGAVLSHTHPGQCQICYIVGMTLSSRSSYLSFRCWDFRSKRRKPVCFLILNGFCTYFWSRCFVGLFFFFGQIFSPGLLVFPIS